MRKGNLIAIVFISLLFACKNPNGMNGVESESGGIGNGTMSKQSLTPGEYVKWVRDEQHGLKKEKTIEDIVFSAQYKPAEYAICTEEKKGKLEDTLVKREKKDLEGMQYFDFKIGLRKGEGELLKYDLSSKEEYDKRVNYFSFNMQKDIQLVDGQDTIPCSLFHFERAYDVTPNSVFELGFAPGKNSTGNKTLIYHDNIFRKGIIKLEFENKDLSDVPQLETEK